MGSKNKREMPLLMIRPDVLAFEELTVRRSEKL
jgi:hypothetical protein